MVNIVRKRITAAVVLTILLIAFLGSYVPVTRFVNTEIYQRFLSQYLTAYEAQDAVKSQSFWLQPQDGGFMTIDEMENILSINHRTYQDFSILKVEVVPVSMGRKVRLWVNLIYTPTNDQNWIIDLVWLRGNLFIIREGPIMD